MIAWYAPRMSELTIVRQAIAHRGRRLEYFTIVWNFPEGLIAIAAGTFGIKATLRSPIKTSTPADYNKSSHFSFPYSVLASFRMGMSGSASFQRAKKSW
jgi:hypothetical protein